MLPTHLTETDRKAVHAGARAYLTYVTWACRSPLGTHYTGKTADDVVSAMISFADDPAHWHEVMSWVLDVAREKMADIEGIGRCPVCNGSFIPRRPNQKTCGRECNARANFEAMRVVSPDDADTIAEMYMDGCTYREIGERVGHTNDRIYSVLNRRNLIGTRKVKGGQQGGRPQGSKNTRRAA